MDVLLGTILGGLLAVYLIYALLHWAIFKRTTKNPYVSRVLAVSVAGPLSATLQGFLGAGSGDFDTLGFTAHLLAWPLIIVLATRAGRNERLKQEAERAFE